MLALAPLPRRDVALVVPTVAVNTAEAYGWLAAEREAAGFSVVPGLLMAEGVASWEGLAALATNHFEPAVFARHPELSRLRDALRGAGADLAMMSGSGSTIFGVFSAAIDRVALADAVAAAGTARIVMTHTATAAADVRLILD
jgi:4-diphosphocytidyl-2-C-methyl-D-erythritol kinase